MEIKFSNIAVFVLFFGIALIEAFLKGNWLEAVLFTTLGAIFLWSDFEKK